MSRSRMFGDADPDNSPDNRAKSPRTTIVGGRPPEPEGDAPPVPTGIQRLLRLASVDDDFRSELVARRDDVAEAAGVALTASEVAILRAIPAEQVVAMAASLPPPDEDRRTFLRQTAATAVMLLGGAALASCASDQKKGCAPRATPGPARTNVREMMTAGGAAPDQPPPRPTTREMETEGGAAPDEPPPNREEHRMPAPGGAAPDIPRPRPPAPDGGTDAGKDKKTRGIRPDIPPPRPSEDPTIRGKGGSRPDIPRDDD